MNANDIKFFIVNLFLDVFMARLAHIYLCTLSPSEKSCYPRHIQEPVLMIFSLLEVIWYIVSQVLHPYAFTLVLYPCYVLYARFMFHFRWKESIFYVMLFYFLTHYALRTVSWCSVQLLGVNVRDYGIPLFPALIGDCAILLIASGTIFFFRKRLRLVAGYLLSNRELLNILLLGCPLVYFCHTFQLMTMSHLYFPAEMVVIRDVVSLCAASALIGIVTSSKTQTEQLERQKIQALLESQYEQFQLKQQSTELIMAKCHDLQKQLHLFQTTNQPEHLEQYKRELQQTIQDLDSLYETGNPTIDALLSDAILKCRNDSVQLICLLDGRSFEFIRPIDLCTIFGNALDNAIESVLQIPNPEKRIIHVRATEKKNFLFLRFENYYEHELKWQDSELQTSKEEKEGHGYGIKSIGYAVKKYHGDISYQARDGRFVLTITFPL